MKEKSQNKSAVRTRKWITDSLISLMESKDFKDISISEIVENADVSRQSFYRHYETKEEIIDDFFYENIINKFNSSFDKNKINSIHSLLEFYFNFWHENSCVLDVIVKTNYTLSILDEYDKLMRTHLANSLELITGKLNTSNKKNIEIIKSFIIGGLYNTKIQWTKTGCKESPAHLAEIVEKTFFIGI